MKQMYKEIAKVIKKRIEFINTAITKKYREPLLAVMELMVNDFADYFEREDKKEYFKTHNPKDDIYLIYNFNRQHFIKMCGVEE